MTALVDNIDAKLRAASRFAVVPGDRAKGEGRRIGDQDPKADKAGESPPRNQPPDQQGKAQPGDGGRPGKNGGGKNPGSQQPDKSGGQGDSKEKGKAQGGDKSDDKGNSRRRDKGQNRDGENRQPADRQQAVRPPKETSNSDQRATPPPSPPSGSGFGGFLQFLAASVKWLIYAAIAVAVAFLLIRHWSRFIEMLAKFWADLLAAFGGRRGDERDASAEPGAAPLPVVRFAAFENPFFSGAAGRMPPAQLVRYTFEALEAWARERVVARPPEQTPLEFAQELGRRDPALAKDVTSTAELYVRVAYAQEPVARIGRGARTLVATDGNGHGGMSRRRSCARQRREAASIKSPSINPRQESPRPRAVGLVLGPEVRTEQPLLRVHPRNEAPESSPPLTGRRRPSETRGPSRLTR